MLAVVAAEGAALDAGSVALGLARRWCHDGENVLFVDAGLSGSTLAQRLGAVDHAEYSAAVRGLPSLLVAREPLTLQSVAAHCYSLEGGRLWALFGPSHPSGGEHAARWLADRVDELQAIDRRRRVVLASSIRPDAAAPIALLRAVRVLVALAPVQDRQQAGSLWRLFHDAGLMGLRRGWRGLIVEGASPLDDDEIRVESGMHVAARLPLADDDGVLRLRGTRRNRALARHLDKSADRLLALVKIEESEDDAERGPPPPDEPEASEGPSGQEAPPGRTRLNGARPGPDRLLSPRRLLRPPAGVRRADRRA